MDEQTMRDQIEDLLIERAELWARIHSLQSRLDYANAEVNRLEKLASRERP